MKKLTHEEIIRRQAQVRSEERAPIFALLNNIRSLYNVGSMFRSADGAGLSRLYLAGITGTPPAPGLLKTSLGAENEVPWEYAYSATEKLASLRKQNIQILLLEQTHESVLYDAVPVRFPCCLVVGNELSGVDEDVVSLADYALEIPMRGAKNSLNVSVAFGIVVYELLRKYKERNAQIYL